MKKAILLSALLAWAAVALVSVTIAKAMGYFDGHLFFPILIYTFYTGIIAFPSCLIAGTLVNLCLPASSPWWGPKYAALCGGFSGILAAALIVVLITRDFEFDRDRWMGVIISAVPGAVCGFSLAWFRQRLLKPEPPTAPP